MKTEEIEGNILIGKFHDPKWDYNGDEDHICRYHQFWDYLMPVVEKIEQGLPEEFRVVILEEDCTIWQKTTNQELMIEFTDVAGVCCASSKIEAVWLAIIEFIKWYNHDQGKG